MNEYELHDMGLTTRNKTNYIWIVCINYNTRIYCYGMKYNKIKLNKLRKDIQYSPRFITMPYRARIRRRP